MQRRFEHALLIGCPDREWPIRLGAFADAVEARDPGRLFAQAAPAQTIVEDAWEPPARTFDLIVAIGTFDTVNHLPLALRLVRHAMATGALFMGALSGGDTLPQLRLAMRAADSATGVASPHVHPRIEASAIAPLLTEAGFANPVVDVDRVPVSYPTLDRLVVDLRGMGATNVLTARPRFIGKAALATAARAFAAAGGEGRTTETFEILHFAAWSGNEG
jgi:hypothetical protein